MFDDRQDAFVLCHMLCQCVQPLKLSSLHTLPGNPNTRALFASIEWRKVYNMTILATSDVIHG